MTTKHDLAAKAQDAYHYLRAASGRESAFSGQCWTLRGRLETYTNGREAAYACIDLADELGLVFPNYGFDFLSADPQNEVELGLLAERGYLAVSAWCTTIGIDACTADVSEV